MKIENISEIDDHDVIYALRTAHQNQTQLIILADHKANVLVGIVAVTLTILFTNINFLNDVDHKLSIPLACFILMEIIALFLALLVIMPKTTGRSQTMKLEDIPNPLFFGFFTKFKEDEYVMYLTDKMHDNQSARKFLARDLYQIGVVLKRKYLLLKYAYGFAVAGVVSLLCSTFVLLFMV